MKKGIVLIMLSILLIACADKAWEKAQKDNTISAYKSYITENPAGEFIEQAKLKVDELIKDSNEWALTIKENSLESYQNYLDTYPEGVNIKEANQKVKELQKIINEETEAWEKADSENTFASYNNYLDIYKKDGVHSKEGFDKRKEKFIELLTTEFRTVHEFFNICNQLKDDSHTNPEFDKVYSYFSSVDCEIDRIKIQNEVNYKSLQVTETRNIYYQLIFTGEFYNKLMEGDFELYIYSYPEKPDIELKFSFIEDETIEYFLNIKFETQEGKLKIIELQAIIDEPGC